MNYEQVPDIFTVKDLDYLCDMVHLHYGVYKETINRVDNVSDEEVSNMMQKCADIFYDHMQIILDTLNGGMTNEW